jgi:hypothetical protein
MRRGGLLIAVAALVLIILVIVAVSGPKRSGKKLIDHGSDAEIITLSEAVPYCPAPLSEVPHGRVQVLVDSSGSMAGVRGPVISYLRWLEQSISRLRDSSVIIDELRIARFDRTAGIRASSSVADFARDYSPSAETTLHEAIRASKDYDLTFIVTDGVAAAGSGSGDCAAGVDAACVARALRDAVHTEQTSLVAPQPGVWLVPLWTHHAGIYYTEKPTGVADFDRTSSLQNVHDEIGQDISIANPRPDSHGNLVYDYNGPRGILLIVIAQSDDLGRRAISALQERMGENNVVAIENVKEAKTTLSAWPAIELYPGYLPPIEWVDLKESDEKPPNGTIDVEFTGRRRIAVDCPRGKDNATEFILSSRNFRANSHCVSIHQLPAFEFGFVAQNPRDETALASLLDGYERKATKDGDHFVLRLRCGKGEERPCSADPIRARWTMQSRYDRSGESGEARRSDAHSLIAAISTMDPVAQPHRIYGLDSLLSIFFDEVRQDHKKVTLADIEFCHRSAGAK